MAFIALVIAFALEQFRPLPARSALTAFVEALAAGAERRLNAGQPGHGRLAWWLLVGGAALVTFAIHEALLLWLGWWAALPFSVLVLYLSAGFRKFSHPYKEIQLAIERGDFDGARRELTAWKRAEQPEYDGTALEIDELIRQTLVHGLLQTQRHVFGVLFWYALLGWAIGPAGAVVYGLALALAWYWNRPTPETAGLPPDRFGEYAATAAAWIDFVPARLAALGFAIVGDFEGAVYCWRRAAALATPVAGRPALDAPTLLLAAASGALGTRLVDGGQAGRLFAEPGYEGADLVDPAPRTLAAGAAMMWRAVVLWLGLLALLTVVAWAP